MKYTRLDYMTGICTFEEYDQFVDDELVHEVDLVLGKRVMGSRDPMHFNDIHIEKWENMAGVVSGRNGYFIRAPQRIVEKMKEARDAVSISGMVCVYKAAARRLRRQC